MDGDLNHRSSLYASLCNRPVISLLKTIPAGAVVRPRTTCWSLPQISVLKALFRPDPQLRAQSVPQPTHKQPVTDVYHGVKVTDGYRWLEDLSNPETQAWSETQNIYARKYLNALPGRATLREQITALLSKQAENFAGLTRRGGKLFALHFQPPKEQPFLIVLESPDHPDLARVTLDPVQLDPSGRTTIDFYVPSRDGRYVAVSLSKAGSESGDVHVYETSTGKSLPDVIQHVNGGTAGGSVAWKADGSGFLLHAIPAFGRAPDGGSRVLSAGLVSSSRH